VVIVKRWLLTTKRLQLLSRRRTLNLPRLIVSLKQTFVKERVFKVTRRFYNLFFAFQYLLLEHRTLKVYRKGEATEYGGPRKADGIISYMTK